MSVGGILLVGGLSRRYGKPKALEKLDEKTFLERVFDAMKQVVDEIYVVYTEYTPWEVLKISEYLGGKLVKDRDLNCSGPPRGLVSTYLSSPKREEYVIAAVDHPFITGDILRKIVEYAHSFESYATTPLPEPGYPMISVGYVRREALEVLVKACELRQSFTRFTDVYRGSRLSVFIGWSLLSNDFKPFTNINRPEPLSAKPIPVRSLVFSDGDLFVKALECIEKKDVFCAGGLYFMEAEIYGELGLSLFKIHASKDSVRFLGLN